MVEKFETSDVRLSLFHCWGFLTPDRSSLLHMFVNKSMRYVRLLNTTSNPQHSLEVSILTENLAPTQSGVSLGGEPRRALDGNTSGQWTDGCVELLQFTFKTYRRC